MNQRAFWQGKKVFLTGQTGFKGSWLGFWLHHLGARVAGYALEPPTQPSLFQLCRLAELIDSQIADVCDLASLKQKLVAWQPEIVFHLAAQPIVRESYQVPVETYNINVMGTVHLLEAVRNCPSVRAVVNVTTDKVYQYKGKPDGYQEDEALGGHDPYSSSKACSELVSQAYRSSYFNPKDYQIHQVGLATARAGNVIGGGDWAADRLVPDFIRAILDNQQILIRNPKATRPWQHVLEPLSGYLLLAQKLYENGVDYASAWNFGPAESANSTVEDLVKALCDKWGDGAAYALDQRNHPHEAHYLKLNSDKARIRLGWQPKWSLAKALDSIIDWTKKYQAGQDLRQVCLAQIKEYEGSHEQ